MWAAANTTGPILELGCGAYSTPLLHLLCPGRRIVSADNNRDFATTFMKLITDWHEVHHIDNWEAWPLIDEKWDVAFVDQAPAEAREPSLHRLRDNCKYVVVHDTELMDYYGYSRVFPTYKHVIHCDWQPKRVSILSMTEPMDDLRELLELKNVKIVHLRPDEE